MGRATHLPGKPAVDEQSVVGLAALHHEKLSVRIEVEIQDLLCKDHVGVQRDCLHALVCVELKDGYLAAIGVGIESDTDGAGDDNAELRKSAGMMRGGGGGGGE